MKLTSKGRYSIQAILDLTNNSNGKAVRLADIADRQKLSLNYLEQLFRKLRKAGVVKSVRGPGGGYVLAKPATEITIESVLHGVDELVGYKNSVGVGSNFTKEQNSVAAYLGTVDGVINSCLNKTLNELV
jgi:Rrf2 family protein